MTKDDVAQYSLELADKFALSSDEAIDSIAAKIYAEING